MADNVPVGAAVAITRVTTRSDATAATTTESSAVLRYILFSGFATVVHGPSGTVSECCKENVLLVHTSRTSRMLKR